MVEKVMEPRYVAFDGRKFDTFEEAQQHEAQNFESLLVELTTEQVRGAVARDPKFASISAALEKAGTTIARARVAAGDVKRRTKARAAAEAGTSQQGAQDEEQADSEPEADAAEAA